MKKIILIVLVFVATIGFAQEKISPFYNLGILDTSIESLTPVVKEALTTAGFRIIGVYNPENRKDLKVIAYTSNQLVELTGNFKDRGLLAATLKVGLEESNGKTRLSMLNPEYQFIAYLYEGYGEFANQFSSISDLAINTLKPLGNGLAAFGGEENKEKLHKYHYKVMMPYFTSPVELNEYASFKEGLETIQKNLASGVGNTSKVYEIIDEENQIAVFGIGLFDSEKGEPDFLPVIGESNLAAMPYDIILQGNTASMLHGKYRIALYWPELTMGTFMKIMSTPKNIKRFMEGIAN